MKTTTRSFWFGATVAIGTGCAVSASTFASPSTTDRGPPADTIQLAQAASEMNPRDINEKRGGDFKTPREINEERGGDIKTPPKVNEGTSAGEIKTPRQINEERGGDVKTPPK